MESEKAHRERNPGKTEVPKLRNEKEPPFPETEKPLCRGLVAPESQSEIQEEHRPSCMTEILQKPPSSSWECARTKADHP